MIAAKIAIPRNANRRHFRSFSVDSDPDQLQEHQQDRELERQPERDRHQDHERDEPIPGEDGGELFAGEPEEEVQALEEA